MSRATAASLLVAIAVVAACDRRTAVRTCDDSLQGVWVTPNATRWMLLDHGATLEGYPLFDDSVPEGAPRVIDLARGERLDGEVKRRFMRRAATCDARAPIRVTACKNDTLELVLADPARPLTYPPCSFGPPSPSRAETWRRGQM
jgi:hypothetical protein